MTNITRLDCYSKHLHHFLGPRVLLDYLDVVKAAKRVIAKLASEYKKDWDETCKQSWR
jgi:hypothetical protein